MVSAGASVESEIDDVSSGGGEAGEISGEAGGTGVVIGAVQLLLADPATFPVSQAMQTCNDLAPTAVE